MGVVRCGGVRRPGENALASKPLRFPARITESQMVFSVRIFMCERDHFSSYFCILVCLHVYEFGSGRMSEYKGARVGGVFIITSINIANLTIITVQYVGFCLFVCLFVQSTPLPPWSAELLLLAAFPRAPPCLSYPIRPPHRFAHDDDAVSFSSLVLCPIFVYT